MGRFASRLAGLALSLGEGECLDARAARKTMANKNISYEEFLVASGHRKPAKKQPRKVKAADLTTEAHVALACREYLEASGWLVHRLQADRHRAGGNRKKHERQEVGTPDYIVHKTQNGEPHLVFYLEVKRAVGGKLRQSQIEWRLSHPRELVCVANSVEVMRKWMETWGFEGDK